MKIVESLLKAGANANYVDTDGFTPLHIAVVKGELIGLNTNVS